MLVHVWPGNGTIMTKVSVKPAYIEKNLMCHEHSNNAVAKVGEMAEAQVIFMSLHPFLFLPEAC